MITGEKRKMYVRIQDGFSFTEVIIAMAVGSVVLAGVYGTFLQQRQVYTVQEDILEMQQNVRLGLDLMGTEIRMAGFSPTGAAITGFEVATEDVIRFKMDMDTIQYNVSDDDSVPTLERGTLTSAPYPVLSNISNLNFCYFLVSNPDACISTPTATQLADIRAVQMTLTARAAHKDPYYTTNDGYRTLTRNVIVQIRNLVLKRGET